MVNDAELVEAALAGGPDSFGPIVQKYQDAVFGVALARVGRFQDAEDVAQGVFIDAFEHLAKLRNPSGLGAWLRTMAINRSIDFIRRRREVTGEETMANVASKEDPRKSDLREEVLAAIAKLGKAQRETVTLFYINGYSVDEVAAMQQSPVGTVKSRLHEARKRLKEDMIHMVENVLKSEAPKDDFAARVFELLTTSSVSWDDLVRELRQIGEKGFAGFVQASQSPNSRIRTMAVHMLQSHCAPMKKEEIISLLKQALADTNKKVRRCAVQAILEMSVADERKTKEFLPLVLPLIHDPSKRVRREVAWMLGNFAAVVPWRPVMEWTLKERDPEAAKRVRCLIQQMLDAGNETMTEDKKR